MAVEPAGQPAPRAADPAHLALAADIEAAGATGRRRTRGRHRRGPWARGVPSRRQRRPEWRGGSRWASDPTIERPLPSSTATCPRARPSPESSLPSPPHAHPMRQGTHSTVSLPNGSCGGGSSRSRGSSGWNRFATPSRRCRARASSTERHAPPSATRLDGTPAVIVCSVGVDLDVIPYAADARLAAGVGAGGSSPVETLVVLPERDLLPVTRELANQLRHSVSLVALSAD